MGMALAGFLLVPAVAFLWALWSKFSHPVPPEALRLGVTGAGALVVNLACAFILAAHRHTGGSLSHAAFLSARNDALANVGIIAAGIATLFTHSLWPDVIVGLAIALMNLGAAREVWEAAREERREAAP
jgi:Co/Zn/Cd efflux system component